MGTKTSKRRKNKLRRLISIILVMLGMGAGGPPERK
jgi:hypothetical protein